MRCCATCRGRRSLHWHRSRFPANGAAPRGGRRLSIMGLAGRDGFAGDAVNPSVEAWPRLARVRCPAHTARPGLSLLPNPPEACLGPMPRTPPQTHPARPRTVSVRVHHGKEREDQKRKRIASLCIHAWRGSTVSTKVDTYRQSQFIHRHRECVGGGAVWGCRTVGAMDGAIEPPRTGLRRVLQPHTAPPNHHQSRAAVAVAVAVASAGAGLQALQSNYVTQPAITSRARIASHSSSIRHTRLIASRRSGNRCHTGNSPASV